MPKYRIKHITRYRYASPVIDSANQVMLFPIDDEMQQVVKQELLITNQPSVEIFNDYFGNKVGVFSIVKPHAELLIQSNIEVITAEHAVPQDTLPAATQWQDLEKMRNEYPYMEFLQGAVPPEGLATIVREELEKQPTPFALAQSFSSFIYSGFEYKKGITSVETRVEEIWQLKAGVCQDFANILLVMLRLAGIPARYVSGYICPKDHELRGEGATHAWVEAFIPAFGWLGLDPTNNCLTGDRHVKLAIGRNFSDCTPVKGTYKGSSEHILEVAVTIENGKPTAPEDTPAPVFTYQVHQPGATDNSYRRFMEMQQQQ